MKHLDAVANFEKVTSKTIANYLFKLYPQEEYDFNTAQGFIQDYDLGGRNKLRWKTVVCERIGLAVPLGAQRTQDVFKGYTERFRKVK